MKVEIRHLREAGLCGPGLYAWARARGFSLHDLLRNGLDLDDHPELADDPFIVRVRNVMRREQAGG